MERREEQQREEQQKEERLKNVLRTISVIIVLAGIYYIAVSVMDRGIPCVFRLVTGLECPGCGMTRALRAAAQGDLAGAFRYNVLSVTLLPVFGLYLAGRTVRYVRTGRGDFHPAEIVFLLVCVGICAVYFLKRNHLM